MTPRELLRPALVLMPVKPKRLVYALIDAFPRGVPVDEVVAVVWDHHPPAEPRKVLASVVSRTNKAISEFGFRIKNDADSPHPASLYWLEQFGHEL